MIDWEQIEKYSNSARNEVFKLGDWGSQVQILSPRPLKKGSIMLLF